LSPIYEKLSKDSVAAMIFIDYERFLQHQALTIIAKQDGYSPKACW